MGELQTSTVQATKTSMTVLRVLRRLEGAGVTEVGEALGIPKSTAHKHLHTLQELGYVTNEGGTYDVGLPLVGFGQYVRERDPLFGAARPAVESLSESTDGVAGLFVVRSGRGFDVYRGGDTTGEDAVPPLPAALHCSAPGKAILAEFDDERLDAVVERSGLAPHTDQTMTEWSTLEADLERIRVRGIAFDREEAYDGVHGVAVPVTADGAVQGAIYVVGNKHRLAGKWFNENVPGIVLSAVNSVEQRLRE